MKGLSTGLRFLPFFMLLLGGAAAAKGDGSGLDYAQTDAKGLLRDYRSGSADGSGPAVAGLPPGTSVERRIVVYRPGADPGRVRALAAASGAVVTHELRLIHAIGIAVPGNFAAASDAFLAAAPEVERIERDGWRYMLLDAAGTASRASAADPAAQVPWGIERVHAPQAWPVTRGAGVTVCVVDTGIDARHPDLRVAAGYNAVDPSRPFIDDHGHGTHVSGTLAGLGVGGGVTGVAPDVTLIGAKALDSTGHGSYATMIAGMQWCVEKGAKVVNMSMGNYEGTRALADAVVALTQTGALLVAAAGNNYGHSVAFPAAYPQAIAVTASDDQDHWAGFSSRGPEVDLIAPGVDVLSTYNDGGYKAMSGTSMASPHVAGMAALAAARGAIGPEGIRSALYGAAVPLRHVVSDAQGRGMPDAARLVGAR